MPIVIRYQCHACGAPSEPHGETWSRCTFCKALLGLDIQAWLESADYRRWLAGAATLGERFKPYQALEAEAEKLGRVGKMQEAVAKEREAQRILIELTPHVFPPEVKTDPVYREKYLWLHAWFAVQQKCDPQAASLNDQMMATLKAIDWKDPMKAVRPAADLLTRTMRRIEMIPGAPEDPDAMPRSARVRVWISQFLSAYVHLLGKQEDRLELLRSIHGKDNVRVVGDAQADETGLFRDWTCPACALTSL